MAERWEESPGEMEEPPKTPILGLLFGHFSPAFLVRPKPIFGRFFTVSKAQDGVRTRSTDCKSFVLSGPLNRDRRYYLSDTPV